MTSAEVREQILDSLILDLVGPVAGLKAGNYLEQEILPGATAPLRWYLTGFLAPFAAKPEEIQYRFSRAPWLIEGQRPAEVIRENVRLASAALKTRLANGETRRDAARAVAEESGWDRRTVYDLSHTI